MRRKSVRRYSALILVAMAASWWLGGLTLAESTKFDDENGEGAAVDKIDITEFGHDSVGNSITYELTFLDNWNNNQLKEMVWTIDFKPNDGVASEDACIELTPQGNFGINGALLDDCIDSIADDIDVVHASGSSEMTVTYPKAALVEANDDKPVKEYAYRIVATDADAGAGQSNDFAPDANRDPVVHKLAAAGAGASPTPKPSDDPADDLDDLGNRSGLGDDDDSDDDSDSDSDSATEVLSASQGGPRLPDTGSPTLIVFTAGSALLGAGSLLRLAARRGRQ